MRKTNNGLERSRLCRVIHLLTLVDDAEPLTPRKLAHKFGVSTRTIYRDLALIEEVGKLSAVDLNQGRLSLIVPLARVLSVRELSLTLVAARAIQVISGPQNSEVLLRSILKLIGFLPKSDRQSIAHLLQAFKSNAEKDVTFLHDKTLATILRAVNEQKPVSIRFKNIDDTLTTNSLTITKIQPSVAEWELHGMLTGTDRARVIKLGRIQSLRIDEE